MSTLSIKYWFDPRNPRITEELKRNYEFSFDLLNFGTRIFHAAKPCCEVPADSCVYFVIHEEKGAICYIGSTQCLSARINDHIKQRKFNPDTVKVGWLKMPKNKSMRRIEENYIWRYKPALNTAIKHDDYRERYSFCWCGELSYSHDLCLFHFEEFISWCGWDTPDNWYENTDSLLDITEGLVVLPVHNDIQLTRQRNVDMFRYYPNTAAKYLHYVAKGDFNPGQVQVTKTKREGVWVCAVMLRCDRFRFMPWFEHAKQEDYDCFLMGLQKVANIAKKNTVPVYIPHAMGQDYGMCWHYTSRMVATVFSDLSVFTYTV